MIELTQGDLLAADADALVNTVNCEGFMGRGVALQFKKRWPENFRAYEAACRRGEVKPGRMLVFATGRLVPPRFIINFPTKRLWRNKSRIEDIEAGLAALVEEIRARGIRSIALPPLGSGLGGLDWRDVRPRIEKALGALPDVRVLLFEPRGAGAPSPAPATQKAPPMTTGRAALVGLMERYIAGLLDPFISLLEVHKLMYFMQEAGEPLRLRIVKAPFGPYVENLRHVLHALDGHFITGYGDGGDAPDKTLEVVPGAAELARSHLSAHAETLARFDRVGSLIDGFESPSGMELLATVHWVATREGAASLDAIVAKTYEWNESKRRFTRGQLELATHVLGEKGWIEATPVA